MKKNNLNSSDWQKTYLSDVTEYINRGIPPVYTEDASGTAVVNQRCIRDGSVNLELAKKTDEVVKSVPQDKLLHSYDILINSTGTGTVGRVGQIDQIDKRITVDTHVTIVRPKKKVIDPVFLGHILKSKEKYIENLAGGSTNQVELSRNKINDIPINIPPLPIQQKIAIILSTVDQYIKKTDQIIQKTEELKKGLMQQLFTKGIVHTKFKKTKLGMIPEGWEVKQLYDSTIILKDGTHGTHKNFSTGIPLLSAKDIIHGKILFDNKPRLISREDYKKIHKNYTIQQNDVLLTIVGTIGRVALVPFTTISFSVQRSVAIIRLKDFLYPLYSFYFFQSDIFQISLQKGTHGLAQGGIYLNELGKQEIFIPSLQEQQQIAEILSKVDDKINTNKDIKGKLLELKKGLMQDLFNNKLQNG